MNTTPAITQELRYGSVWEYYTTHAIYNGVGQLLRYEDDLDYAHKDLVHLPVVYISRQEFDRIAGRDFVSRRVAELAALDRINNANK